MFFIARSVDPSTLTSKQWKVLTPQAAIAIGEDRRALLENAFLGYRLPPWYSIRLNRMIKTPPILVGDSGVLKSRARLLGDVSD